MATLLQCSITLGSLLFPQNFKIYLLPVIQSKSFSSDYKKIQLKNEEKNKKDVILSDWSKEDQIFHDIKSLEYASNGLLNYKEMKNQIKNENEIKIKNENEIKNK